MKVAIFSFREYEKAFFEAANHNLHQLDFFREPLTEDTVKKIDGFDAVCCFVTDTLNETVITQLKQKGIKLIAMRSAGYDQVDIQAANALNLPVVRVPSYSPESIAEFTIGMLLALSRKLLSAHDNVKRHNFALDYQIGFNLNKKTVGVIGTGKIGSLVAKLLLAFGCKVLAYDINPNTFCKSLGVQYVEITTLYQQADIITLHCPLTSATKHLINDAVLHKVQPHAIIINTGRGALIDTIALISALKTHRVAAVGLDVYEEESKLFFENRSNEIIEDDVFIRLQSFPNVFITGHQAYLTNEALTNISKTTIDNLTAFENNKIKNLVNKYSKPLQPQKSNYLQQRSYSTDVRTSYSMSPILPGMIVKLFHSKINANHSMFFNYPISQGVHFLKRLIR